LGAAYSYVTEDSELLYSFQEGSEPRTKAAPDAILLACELIDLRRKCHDIVDIWQRLFRLRSEGPIFSFLLARKIRLELRDGLRQTNIGRQSRSLCQSVGHAAAVLVSLKSCHNEASRYGYFWYIERVRVESK
jgi:hypothetical protein